MPFLLPPHFWPYVVMYYLFLFPNFVLLFLPFITSFRIPRKKGVFFSACGRCLKKILRAGIFCSTVLRFFACVPSSISRKSTKKTFLALTLRVFSLSLPRQISHQRKHIFSFFFRENAWWNICSFFCRDLGGTFERQKKIQASNTSLRMQYVV